MGEIADDMAKAKRNVAMIGNNVAVSRVFTERITKKYDMMYSQRALVHWYVGEGMDRESSPRPVRTLASSRRTTSMSSPNRLRMRLTRRTSSKYNVTRLQREEKKSRAFYFSRLLRHPKHGWRGQIS